MSIKGQTSKIFYLILFIDNDKERVDNKNSEIGFGILRY